MFNGLVGFFLFPAAGETSAILGDSQPSRAEQRAGAPRSTALQDRLPLRTATGHAHGVEVRRI